MSWFRRRRKSANAAKLKEGRPAAAADRTRPVAVADHAQLTQPRHVLQQHRSRGQTRTSSRSTDSMRNGEKHDKGPPEPAAFAADSTFRKEAYLPQSSAEDITALPDHRPLAHSPHLRPISQEPGTIPYNFHSQSHSSLPSAKERGKLQRPQSLRKSAAAESLIRRKSSKRRKDHDHIREEEIRAMSLPMPQKRPANNSGGMLRRDSKKVKSGWNSRSERPTSNISLPFEDSIHSSMSGTSERRAFRVSALDMFSPRPTVRCSTGSQYYAVDRTSPTAHLGRSDSRRERKQLSSKDEKQDKQRKRTSRIDDLADTLDAGALREILERDKRRKEKKSKADQERLRRRLERRAEMQHAAEVGGTPATPRRAAVGVVGLGIERNMSEPMEDVRPSTPQPPYSPDPLPVTPQSQINNQLPTPLGSPTEEPVVSAARAVRYSRGSVSGPGHARGHSNVSELPELMSKKVAYETPVHSSEHIDDPFRSGSLHAIDTVDTNTSKQGSTSRRSSDGRRMNVFASFFRRNKRHSQDQGRTTPSEISFSNTSRESMSRQPLPAHLVGTLPATPPVQIQRPSNVPRRTMSKFREDLPEFPLSPPDSRVQSPEVSSASAIAARRRSPIPSDLRVESLTSQAAARSDSPVSPGAPTTNIMSQSLASVDSEASWLSGKPLKRASNRSQLRSSVGSSAVQKVESFSASYEELGMADDEYFRRLTPQPDEHRRSTQSSDMLGRKASSTLMSLDPAAEAEEEQEILRAQKRSAESSDEEEYVKRVPGRQPTIVHRQPRFKSTEGLLSYYLNGKNAQVEAPSKTNDEAAVTPDSPSSETEQITVQRASSVNLGKQHVRHLSAGSAKLLDIQKRSSVSSHHKAAE